MLPDTSTVALTKYHIFVLFVEIDSEKRVIYFKKSGSFTQKSKISSRK